MMKVDDDDDDDDDNDDDDDDFDDIHLIMMLMISYPSDKRPGYDQVKATFAPTCNKLR